MGKVENAGCKNFLLFQHCFQKLNSFSGFSVNSLSLDASFNDLLKTLWERKKILVTCTFYFSHNVSTVNEKPPFLVAWLYWGLTPLWQLRSYHGGRWCTCVSWLSYNSTNTTFLSKAHHFWATSTLLFSNGLFLPFNTQSLLLTTLKRRAFENLVGKG